MAKDLINQLFICKDRLVEESLKGFEESKLLRRLISGTVMNKYAYNNGKKHPREFSISPDLKYFQWKIENSNRKLRRFSINDINDVVIGNSEFSCKVSSMNLKNDSENLCFTIKLKQRNVDIVAPTDRERDMWVRGVSLLIGSDEMASEKSIKSLDEEINDLKKHLLKKSKSEVHFEGAAIDNSSDEGIIENEDTKKFKNKIKSLEQERQILNDQIKHLTEEIDKKTSEDQSKKKQMGQRDKQIKEYENQIEILKAQCDSAEKDYTQRTVSIEEKLTQKDTALMSLQAEYEEFKKQIKDSFNKTLVQKVQQYRESKEVLCSYVAYLKQRLDSIEKEVSLWQAVVHTHVLPVFQAKKPGRMPQFKEVLSFALDIMERKLDTDRSQTQFISLLNEARKNVKSS
ncbi:unnamed protein product [Blepharisma stoltei]|uniref:PH domain-containing protein n=1 Tax=Blepharisma stoltei TaxID=1481888 RepID=A0AAU9J9U2_9CILI|nr:unnamed protein product [Blepharisma stoltei]